MTIVENACSICKHKRKNIDGWKCACAAFPDGIPMEYLFEIDVEKIDSCNDGIGFEKNQKV